MASLRTLLTLVIASICLAPAIASAQGEPIMTPVPPAGYETLPPQPAPSAQPAPAAQPAPPVQPAEPAPPAEEDLHDVSITFSPLHLLFPIGEITAEVRLADRIGVAAIVGAGTITYQDPFGPEQTFTAFELGAQFRYYLVGDFDHGMQLGAELLWVHVSGEVEGGITGSGSGLAVGPFVGYKYSASFGLTFDAQLGVTAAGIGAQATDGTTTETRTETHVGVLLNLNAGWAF